MDACALVAALKDENGAGNVAAIYKQANNGEVKLIINYLRRINIKRTVLPIG